MPVGPRNAIDRLRSHDRLESIARLRAAVRRSTTSTSPGGTTPPSPITSTRSRLPSARSTPSSAGSPMRCGLAASRSPSPSPPDCLSRARATVGVRRGRRTTRKLSEVAARMGSVRFLDLAATSAAVTATSGRKAKIELLADALRRLDPAEIAAGSAYLAGELRQRQTGVGYASLRDRPAPGRRGHADRRRGRRGDRRDLGGGRRRVAGPAARAGRRAVRRGDRRRAAAADRAVRRRAAAGRPGRAAGRRDRQGGRGAAHRGPAGAAALRRPQTGRGRGADRRRAPRSTRSTCGSARPLTPMLAQSAPDVARRAARHRHAGDGRRQARRHPHPGAPLRRRGRRLHPQPRRHHRPDAGGGGRGAQAAGPRGRARRRGDDARRERPAAPVPGDVEPGRHPRAGDGGARAQLRTSSICCTSTAPTCSTSRAGCAGPRWPTRCRPS